MTLHLSSTFESNQSECKTTCFNKGRHDNLSHKHCSVLSRLSNEGRSRKLNTKHAQCRDSKKIGTSSYSTSPQQIKVPSPSDTIYSLLYSFVPISNQVSNELSEKSSSSLKSIRKRMNRAELVLPNGSKTPVLNFDWFFFLLLTASWSRCYAALATTFIQLLGKLPHISLKSGEWLSILTKHDKKAAFNANASNYSMLARVRNST